MSSPVLLYDQSGQELEVHPEDVGKALQQGYRYPVTMTDPQGMEYQVHPMDAAKALQKGWTVGQPAVAKHETVNSKAIVKASTPTPPRVDFAQNPPAVPRPGVPGLTEGEGHVAAYNPNTGMTMMQPGGKTTRTPESAALASAVLPQVFTPSTVVNQVTGTGVGTIGSGVGDVAQGRKMLGATKVLAGVGDTLSPMIGPAALTNPVGVAKALAIGSAASPVAEKAVEVAGGSPEAQMFAGEAAQWLPAAMEGTANSLGKRGLLPKVNLPAVLPDAIYRAIVPEGLQSPARAAKIEAKAVTKQASNLSAAMEMGGRVDKGTKVFEDVSLPINDALRTEAARTGITGDQFKGREGYRAAEKLTGSLRQQYDNAYNALIEPLRNEPASQAARQAAVDVVKKMYSDAALMDELKQSGNVEQLEAIGNAIANADTIGKLDDMRQALNRLSSKYLARSEAAQYTSPIGQEAMNEGANSIRNALYNEVSARLPEGYSVEQIRELQKEHGAAIRANQMMQQASQALSSRASEEAAPAGVIDRLRGVGYRATLSRSPHAAAGVIEKLFPASEVELFNKRMQRVLKGVKADPNAAHNFPTTNLVGAEYVPTPQGPQGVPIPYAPQPPAEQLQPGALPTGLLPSGPPEPLPPHNPARILPIPGMTPKALPPITLQEARPNVPLTNSVEAVGIPQTAEAQALENVKAKRAKTVYHDPQIRRRVEEAGGKYLGSSAGISYFNIDDTGTTVAVPDNANFEAIQNAISEGLKRHSGIVPQKAPGPTPNTYPVQPPQTLPGTGSKAQPEPQVEVIEPPIGTSGQGSGTTHLSNEELARTEKFYKVSKSGNLTFLGKQPDATLKAGEGIIAVKPDGQMRVANANGVGDSELLKAHGPKVQTAAGFVSKYATPAGNMATRGQGNAVADAGRLPETQSGRAVAGPGDAEVAGGRGQDRTSVIPPPELKASAPIAGVSGKANAASVKKANAALDADARKAAEYVRQTREAQNVADAQTAAIVRVESEAKIEAATPEQLQASVEKFKRLASQARSQEEWKLYSDAAKEAQRRLDERNTAAPIKSIVPGLPKIETPTPGSPEYEALKQQVADLQAKKAAPVSAGTTQPAPKPTGNKALADKFRKMADGLESQIEDRRRAMTQNPTPKRMAQYRSRIIEANDMERTQRALRALADAHEAGNVPSELANLRTKDEIGRLVHKGVDSSKGGYYDRVERLDYYDQSPTGKAMQGLMEGKAKETSAEKEARLKAAEISKLEAEVQFSKIPGYFPTPKTVIAEMLDRADIRPGMSVLEPSAGKGDIADAVKTSVPDARIDAVEPVYRLSKILELKGHNVVGSDFMEHGGKQYDRIVMNPPFEKGADMDHVQRAYEMLKPGGRLVSIMGPHFEFGSEKRSVNFRDWLESVNGEIEKLPEGSFKQSGTGVASRMVIIDKPAAKSSSPIPGMPKVSSAESEPPKSSTAVYLPQRSTESIANERVQHYTGKLVAASAIDKPNVVNEMTPEVAKGVLEQIKAAPGDDPVGRNLLEDRLAREANPPVAKGRVPNRHKVTATPEPPLPEGITRDPQVADAITDPKVLETWQKELDGLERKYSGFKRPQHGSLDQKRIEQLKVKIEEANRAVKMSQNKQVIVDESGLPDRTKDKWAFRKAYFQNAIDMVLNAYEKHPDNTHIRGEGAWAEEWKSRKFAAREANIIDGTRKPTEFPGEFVKVEVPGDGKFLIVNKPSALMKVLRESNQSFAKPTFQPATPPKPRKFTMPKAGEGEKRQWIEGLRQELRDVQTQSGDYSARYEPVENFTEMKESVAEEKYPSNQGYRYTHTGQNGPYRMVRVEKKVSDFSQAELDQRAEEIRNELAEFGVGSEQAVLDQVDNLPDNLTYDAQEAAKKVALAHEMRVLSDSDAERMIGWIKDYGKVPEGGNKYDSGDKKTMQRMADELGVDLEEVKRREAIANKFGEMKGRKRFQKWTWTRSTGLPERPTESVLGKANTSQGRSLIPGLPKITQSGGN